jgi:hypothetical protein
VLQVVEERLGHVLRDLPADQLGEVAGLDPERGVDVDLGTLHGRGQDVARRRQWGTLELLAQVGRERRQHRGELRGGAKWCRSAARDPVAGFVPGLRGIRVGLDPVPGQGQHLLGRGGQLVDDPDLQRGGRFVPLPLGQHLHEPVLDAEHPGDPHDAAGSGQQAQRHLGQPVDHALGVQPDPVVAGQPDLQTAAQRGAVHGRDHRPAQRLQLAELGLELHRRRHDRRGVVRAGCGQPGQVAAGEERLLGRRDDHAGDPDPVRDQRVHALAHRGAIAVVHGVHAVLGVVQGDHDDAVGALLPAHRLPVGRTHATRSTIVAMPMPPPTQSVASP